MESASIATLGGVLGVFQISEAWHLHHQIGNNVMTTALSLLGPGTVALSVASFANIPTPIGARERLTIGLVIQAAAFVEIALSRRRPVG